MSVFRFFRGGKVVGALPSGSSSDNGSDGGSASYNFNQLSGVPAEVTLAIEHFKHLVIKVQRIDKTIYSSLNAFDTAQTTAGLFGAVAGSIRLAGSPAILAVIRQQGRAVRRAQDLGAGSEVIADDTRSAYRWDGGAWVERSTADFLNNVVRYDDAGSTYFVGSLGSNFISNRYNSDGKTKASYTASGEAPTDIAEIKALTYE